MKDVVVLYLPAIHQGYVQFLKEHTRPSSKVILVNGRSFAKKYPTVSHLERDLRAVSTFGMMSILETLFQSYDLFGEFSGSRIIEVVNDIEQLRGKMADAGNIVMPDEDVSHLIVSLIPEIQNRVTLVPTKLRWDKSKAFLETSIEVDTVSNKIIPQHVYQSMLDQAGKSVDWWRRVACVAYRNEEIIFAAYNKHLPSDGVLNIMGDPRSNFSAGEHIEYCSAIHAEALLIARAAKTGISLQGATLLVSDFPCPNCAKLIAQTGIKNLFFVQGYSKADGKEVLDAAGITIKQVVFDK